MSPSAGWVGGPVSSSRAGSHGISPQDSTSLLLSLSLFCLSVCLTLLADRITEFVFGALCVEKRGGVLDRGSFGTMMEKLPGRAGGGAEGGAEV